MCESPHTQGPPHRFFSGNDAEEIGKSIIQSSLKLRLAKIALDYILQAHGHTIQPPAARLAFDDFSKPAHTLRVEKFTQGFSFNFSDVHTGSIKFLSHLIPSIDMLAIRAKSLL